MIAPLLIHAFVIVAESSPPLSRHINDDWLSAVVSIELGDPASSKPIGTGFLVGTGRDHMVLVTAAHVVFDTKGAARPGLLYRLPAEQSGTAVVTDAVLEPVAGPWFKSPSADIALRFLGRSPSMKTHWIPRERLIPLERVRAGNPCLVLGFPLGLRSTQFGAPIVRQAVVARADAEQFLVDAAVFPGHSGSPVVYVPPFHVQPPLHVDFSQENGVIGVVVEEVSAQEIAVSSLTGQPRVIFQENAGLGRLVSADEVLSLLDLPAVKERESRLP